MEILRHIQALCIALFVLHTGANISLTAVTPLNSMIIDGLRVRVDFECGSRVTFVCEIKPYKNRNSAVWQVNSKSYALCIFQSCFSYPPYPAYHEISMSVATETFNLTTDPITLAARRSIYSCNDGVTALSVDAIVKVYVSNETLQMDTSKSNQITLTTGCVYPYGKDDMSFKWFISKDRMILQHSKSVRDEIQSITAFVCADTSDCAGAETVQFNSTVTVAVDIFDTGDDYYICAAVQHIDEPDRPRAVHCSVKTYKIRNYITDRPARRCAYWIIFLVILGISRLLILQQFIIFLCKWDSNVWISLAGCFLPGLELLILIYKKDVYCCSKRVTKRILYSLSITITVIDIVLITVFIVWKVTQWRRPIYILGIILYICVSWIESFTIFVNMHARPKCTKCDKQSDVVCKKCKMKYCEECMKLDRCQNTDQQMTCSESSPICNAPQCNKQSVFKCKLCEMNYCEDCVKQDGCKTTNKRMTCGLCEKAPDEIKTYCCECKKYLCNSCCATQHVTCNGISLKHPQHDKGREEDIFCETEKHASRLSAHGYCLKSDRYLCTICLESSILKHELLWIQHHLDVDEDRLCCSKLHTYHTGSYPGFCLKCKLYICLNCSTKHRGDEHHLIMHITEVSRNDNDSDRKYCAKHKDRRAECYSYTEYAYYCADCFEQGRRPKTRENDLKGGMWENKDICCLHEHFDKQWFNSDAYCLICKIYLCRTCYKLHRRFTEHWIKTHTKNTYFCKRCQNKGNLFPVECVDLDSFTLSCAECFEGKSITERGNTGIYNTLIKSQSCNFSEDMICQIHEFPFSVKTTKVKSRVYCFICKVYMCKQCFRKHRRLSCVWEKKGHLKQLKRSHDFERTATGLKWKMCVLIPVVGFFIGLFQLCRRTNQVDVHRNR